MKYLCSHKLKSICRLDFQILSFAHFFHSHSLPLSLPSISLAHFLFLTLPPKYLSILLSYPLPPFPISFDSYMYLSVYLYPISLPASLSVCLFVSPSLIISLSCARSPPSLCMTYIDLYLLFVLDTNSNNNKTYD